MLGRNIRQSFLRLTLISTLASLGAVVLAAQQVPDAPAPQKPSFPVNTKPASTTEKTQKDSSSANTSEQSTTGATLPPSSVVQDMPRGKSAGNSKAEDSGRESFENIDTIKVNVTQVVVPVTIKDNDGHLVDGLLKRDFSLYEDGEPRNINLFTSDPFPLSAAVILDMGMSDTAFKNVKATLPNISAAFSQYDEIALYAYGNNIQRYRDFSSIDEAFSAALRRMTTNRAGRTGGVAAPGGPMTGGPSLNGKPVLGGGPPPVTAPDKESRTLNDAIQRAALDLGQRPKGRRRIVFIISDGAELGSKASFSEVRKLLLSNNILVYAIGVDTAAIPVYDKIASTKLIGQGYGNILPRYVSATGGELYSELTRANIERAYTRITEVARNQYTLGYTTKATASTTYRSIEVRVKRPGLKVFAKDGYYPLPPQKTAPIGNP